MSVQSDAAKNQIEILLSASYPWVLNKELECPEQRRIINEIESKPVWTNEFHFALPRKWAFDYAVPLLLCANLASLLKHLSTVHLYRYSRSIIELDGGTFQSIRTGHASGVGLRNWREKNNAAMSAGWRVWHYAPEEVIKAGRKSPVNRVNSLEPGCRLRNPVR